MHGSVLQKCTFPNNTGGVKEGLSPKDTSLLQKLKAVPVKAAEMRTDVAGSMYINYVGLFACLHSMQMIYTSMF